MPKITVKAIRIDKPGNSLALWLAAHHPDLFLAAFQQAKAASLKQGIQKLGLLGLADGTTTFDAPADSFTDSGVSYFGVDSTAASLPDNLLSDSVGGGSSFLDSVANGVTSAGSTVGNMLSSAGSGLLGAIGSVGGYLTSTNGLNNLSSIAKSYFGAQAASSQAQTQQQVLQTQIARAQVGQPAAPITYTTNAQGQLVPVYSTPTSQGAVYQPLSSAGIAGLAPSSVSVFVSKYGLLLGVGVAGAVVLSVMMRRG